MTAARATAADETFEVIPATELRNRPDIRADWSNIVSSSAEVNVLYASDPWFQCLAYAHGESDLALIVIRAGGRVTGVVPVRRARWSLAFDVSNRSLWTWRTTVAHVLGSLPLFDADASRLNAVVERILDMWPECAAVYFDTVPVDHDWNRSILDASQRWLIYAPDGARPWFLLDLPASSAEYLGTLGGKTRSTLRRKVRKLEEKLGAVSVDRIETPEAIDRFLADATHVSRNSWQQRLLGTRISQDAESVRWFTKLAEQGILRAYIIKCGATPCAFVVGYQFGGVFHYAELGYDSNFNEHSPGTVLLFLLIQDLCDASRCRLLNFGMGDAEYKRRFGTTERRDISYLLLRPTLKHRLVVSAHRRFRAAVKFVRRFVKPDAPDTAGAEYKISEEPAS